MLLVLDLTCHIVLTAILMRFAWKKSLSWFPVIAVFFGGILIDLDHFYDYFLVYGFDWDFLAFVNGEWIVASGKMYLPFHSWEIIILLVLIASQISKWKPVTLALAIGMTGHLCVDTVGHGEHPGKNWLTYRVAQNFNSKNILSTKQKSTEQGMWKPPRLYPVDWSGKSS